MLPDQVLASLESIPCKAEAKTACGERQLKTATQDGKCHVARLHVTGGKEQLLLSEDSRMMMMTASMQHLACLPACCNDAKTHWTTIKTTYLHPMLCATNTTASSIRNCLVDADPRNLLPNCQHTRTFTSSPPMLCATNTTGRSPTPAASSLSSSSRPESGRLRDSPSQPVTGACSSAGSGSSSSGSPDQ
jgi:hypothetical protein